MLVRKGGGGVIFVDVDLHGYVHISFHAGVVFVLIFFSVFFQIAFGHAVWCHSQKKENWTFDRECIKDSGKGLVTGAKILAQLLSLL